MTTSALMKLFNTHYYRLKFVGEDALETAFISKPWLLACLETLYKDITTTNFRLDNNLTETVLCSPNSPGQQQEFLPF